MNLSQTDINVRLQLAGKYYSEMSSTLADSLSYGRNCLEKQMCELNRLSAYISILENYSTLYGVSGLVAQILMVNVCPTLTLNFNVDGVSISGDVALTNNNEATQAAIVAAAINAYQSDYVASINGTDLTTINIYYSSDYSSTMAVVKTGSCEVAAQVAVVNYELTQLVDGDQCYTEEEIQLICEKISEIIGVDFMPIGYSYIP